MTSAVAIVLFSIIFLCQNSTVVFSGLIVNFLRVLWSVIFPVVPLRFYELSPRCIDVLEGDPFVLVCRAEGGHDPSPTIIMI